jgi:DNA topoisomerase III
MSLIPCTGPCQFPTLGFVVARFNEVKTFKPEEFWYIYLSLNLPSKSKGYYETKFNWRRGHLFGEEEAIALYMHVLENPMAKVVKVVQKETKKWWARFRLRNTSFHVLFRKPLPLTTVELQKAGSRLLKLSPKKVLDVG